MKRLIFLLEIIFLLSLVYAFNIDLLYPSGDIEVYKNELFNITLNISCFDSCGEINVSLDPYYTPKLWIPTWGDDTGYIEIFDIQNGNSLGVVDGGTDEVFVSAVDYNNDVVWACVNDDGKLIKINSTNGSIIDIFNIGERCGGIAVDMEGNLWQSDPSLEVIFKINSAGEKICNFSVESPITVSIGKDNSVWAANFYNKSLSRINSSCSLEKSFNVPVSPAEIFPETNYLFVLGESSLVKILFNGTEAGQVDTSIEESYAAMDLEGFLWIANGENLLKLDENLNLVDNYSFSPNYVAVDADNNIWIMDKTDNSFGMINKSSRELVYSGNTANSISGRGDITGIKKQMLNKGLIPSIFARPFYTINSNPWTINLSENESIIISFYINATGDKDTRSRFFVYANKTDFSSGNMTLSWRVSIIEREIISAFILVTPGGNGGGGTGFVLENKSKETSSCNLPYKKINFECCLDDNNNSICDINEKSVPPNESFNQTGESITGFIINEGEGDFDYKFLILLAALIIVYIGIRVYIKKHNKRRIFKNKS